MTSSRFTKPAEELICGGVTLDNAALVPASLLPFKTQWQAIANDLPHGSILIVLPRHVKQQHVARSVASRLREKGQHVRVEAWVGCMAGALSQLVAP